MATDTQQLSQSFASPAFFQNPYPLYDQMRKVQPIYKGSAFKYPGWYVTGYDAAVMILKNKAVFHNRMPLPETTKRYERLKKMQQEMMLFKNEHDHKRLRGFVGKAFSARIIEGYRPYIEEMVHGLLDEINRNKSVDVVMDFAFPLASVVIAKMLGVPEKDRQQFRDWAIDFIQAIDLTRARDDMVQGNKQALLLGHYFQSLIEEKRRAPQEDLISMLIGEENVSDEELLATCILLVIAGHETTVNLISNTVLSLLQHPSQLQRLKKNPMLIRGAIEESLRYESPTQMIARVATEDVEVDGVHIKKDDQVYILLGAANRDPAVFSAPNQFNMTRSPNDHLAFGYGSHFCIGAALARLEAEMATRILFARLPQLQLATTELKWRRLIGFRALAELPVTFA